MERTKLYAAYGSNLNVKQMTRRCQTAKLAGTTKLVGYRLAFTHAGGSGSYLTVIKTDNKEDFVPIGLWSVTDEDEKSLDRYEGYPTFYDKKTIDLVNDCVDVTLTPETDGTLEAFIYIMVDGMIAPPSVNYVETCAVGYLEFDFDLDILRTAAHESVEQSKDLPKIYRDQLPPLFDEAIDYISYRYGQEAVEEDKT